MTQTLKPEQAAKQLNCSLDTVYGLIKSGRLRALKLSRSYRILVEALDELELTPADK